MPKLIQQFRKRMKIVSLEDEISYYSMKKFKNPEISQNSHIMECRLEYLAKFREEFLIEDHITDKILRHFVDEQDSLDKNQGAIYIKVEGSDKVPLKEFVSSYQDFKTYGEHWQTLFNKYRLMTMIQNSESSETNIQMKLKRMRKITKNAHFERMVETGCLGCSQFFYQGNNVLDQTINKTPIVSMPEISKMKDY